MRYPNHLLRKIKKPIRYIGGEYHLVRKDPAAVESRVALLFPDAYEIGMSHLGSRILYHVLNAEPTVAAERFYSPWPDMEAELRRSGLPLLSLENGLPLDQFHLIGISLLYELTFSNILTFLDLAGLPFRSADRDGDAPLVVGGGPVVSNPEPVADFFDLMVLGDGEEVFPQIVRREAELRRAGIDRRDRPAFLRRFADLGGVYVPGLYALESSGRFQVPVPGPADGGEEIGPVHRRWVPDLDAFPLPSRPLVPNTEIVHDRITTEISRGCMQGCRFCHAAVFYRPQRERSVKELVRWIHDTVSTTGYEEVSLVSLSTGDFGGIEDLAEVLMNDLQRRRVGLSFPSLRVSELSARIAEAIATIRKTGFTVAPEAGTQRMRDVINKGISETDILEGILTAYRSGWDLIKLYFMVGLPFETDDDVAGIADLVRRILGRIRSEPDYGARRRKFQINISVSPFVPKPHTPFQWAAMDTPDETWRKVNLVRRGLRDRTIKVSWHDPQISRLEAVFSRGDRRLGAVIEAAWRQGARFDGWGEHFRAELWERAFAEAGLDPDIFTAAVPLEEELPWALMDVGVSATDLRAEWEAAAAARPRPACGVRLGCELPAEESPVRCYACGIGCSLAELARRRRDNLEQLSRLRDEIGGETAIAEPGPPARVRVRFAKQGPAIWMSHLDLVRTIQRVLSRAGVKIRFTQGFHPRPQMGFSPALGVGIASRGELADLQLEECPDDLSRWLEELNAVSVEGIRFEAARVLEEGESSIDEWASRAVYRVRIPRADLVVYLDGQEADSGDPLAWLQGRINELLASEMIPMVRIREGRKPSTRDVRPFVVDSSVAAEGDSLVVNFTAALSARGTLRVDDWLALCLPGYDGEFQAERMALEGLEPEEENFKKNLD